MTEKIPFERLNEEIEKIEILDINKLYDQNIFYPKFSNEDIEKLLRKPRNPFIIDPSIDKNKPKSKPKHIKKSNRAEILSPLDYVFFEEELMDDLVVRTSVPQLLEGQAPIYPGVILFGPPGTGKSEFQKAMCRVYENAGAYSKQISTSAVNSCFVGEFAKNLEKELKTANEQGEVRGLPSFLSFDEGSILAEQANHGGSSVSKHYQEAIDTMKRYLGNDCGKWLVLGISTNQLPEDFEEAMTRDGRLTSFLIGYPSKTQLARMWNHFASRYNVIELNNEQVNELSELTVTIKERLLSNFVEVIYHIEDKIY